MLRVLLTLLCFVPPAMAEERAVTLRFLGGVKKTPLEELTVTIRNYTGDWSVDHRRKLIEAKTDKDGNVSFTLMDGGYYVDINSDRELPYLDRPVGFKSPPNIYSRFIKVGEQQTFEFNLADACRLTLRAVDVDTGKGLPGAVFVTENALGEYWAHAINGDNLGAKVLLENWTDDSLKTDADGNFTRLIGPRHGYTYFAWTAPPGYELAGEWEEVELLSPVGTEKVEHVFKFRKKKT